MEMLIDVLIDVVRAGGSVKLGMDVYNDRDMLLIDGNAVVKDIAPLLKVKALGIDQVPVNSKSNGGLWDKDGNLLDLVDEPAPAKAISAVVRPGDFAKQIKKVWEVKRQAAEKYAHAKNCIKTIISDIQKTGGEFDYQLVENTVKDILDFLIENESGFSYLTREIFSYDDYLYNHSINVCTIATAAMQKLNSLLGGTGGRPDGSPVMPDMDGIALKMGTAIGRFSLQEMQNIATAFFLHDVGKVLIPESILNKKGPLTLAERHLVRRHSYEKGTVILQKNRINDPMVEAVVKYHHSAIYKNEPGAYPSESPSPDSLPVYVKIGKLADIFDAMTAKRCYKDAQSPVSVVYGLFHRYAGKDPLLQLLLHTFVKTVGIYPTGSIVRLKNGQQVVVIDSNGPLVLPFTDTSGLPLSAPADPFDLTDAEKSDPIYAVDRHAELISPMAAYEQLPKYLRDELL